MAKRTVLQAVVACLKADANVASVVGQKVYLGAAPPTIPPPFIVIEIIREPFATRTGTDQNRVWAEAPQLLVRCAATTGDGADLLAEYAKAVLDDLANNALFDVTNTKLSSSLRDDYALTVDPERAPDAAPVFVGAILHTITVTRWAARSVVD